MEAVEDVRSLFDNQGSRLPNNSGVSKQPSPRPEPVPQPDKPSSGERSLTDEFKRMVAAKDSSFQEDEDVPLWDSAVHGKTTENEMAPQVERILSLIPGTVIE